MTSNSPQHLKNCSKHVIPRSRSDFCYVNLTPREKRRTTDFSNLLPHFNRDPPYVRLVDPKSPVIRQPAIVHLPPTNNGPKMCRSSTGMTVANPLTPEVIRSQSMKSLRRTLDMSPTLVKNTEGVGEAVSSVVKPEEEDDYRRLRNFTVTSKGVVNWGDSFRSRSMPFMPSLQTLPSDLGETSSLPEPRVSSSMMENVSEAGSRQRIPTRYQVAIAGSSEVGKTTMIQQFRTSEYICAFDSNSDETSDCVITVILNGEESELEFVDTCSLEFESEEEASQENERNTKPPIPSADAYAIVYSVTNRRSYMHASKLLSRVQSSFDMGTVILVGNKSDLVRTRAVTTDEGRTLAKDHGCKFIETSVAINHQIDELLVGILTQIRTRNKMAAAAASKFNYSQYSLAKAKGLIKQFLKKACFQSKSCDNIQRL